MARTWFNYPPKFDWKEADEMKKAAGINRLTIGEFWHTSPEIKVCYFD